MIHHSLISSLSTCRHSQGTTSTTPMAVVSNKSDNYQTLSNYKNYSNNIRCNSSNSSRDSPQWIITHTSARILTSRLNKSHSNSSLHLTKTMRSTLPSNSSSNNSRSNSSNNSNTLLQCKRYLSSLRRCTISRKSSKKERLRVSLEITAARTSSSISWTRSFLATLIHLQKKWGEFLKGPLLLLCSMPQAWIMPRTNCNNSNTLFSMVYLSNNNNSNLKPSRLIWIIMLLNLNSSLSLWKT